MFWRPLCAVQCSTGQHDAVNHQLGQWLVGYDRLRGSRREGSKEASVAETARSSGVASNPVPVQKTSTEEGEVTKRPPGAGGTLAGGGPLGATGTSAAHQW